MKRTWKSTVGGILSIIAGVISITWGIPRGFEWPFTIGIPAVTFGTIAIVGGIYALRRRRWGLALAGSICSLIGCEAFRFPPLFFSDVLTSSAFPFDATILGILAIMFVVLGRHEFK